MSNTNSKLIFELLKMLPDAKFELSDEYVDDDIMVYHNSADLRINLGKYACHIEEIQSSLNNEFILKYKPSAFGEKYSDEVLNYFDEMDKEDEISLDYEDGMSDINKSVSAF